jgi:hypothetical protein
MEETMFRKREISTSPSVNPNLYLESYMKISSVREDETFLNANRLNDLIPKRGRLKVTVDFKVELPLQLSTPSLFQVSFNML